MRSFARLSRVGLGAVALGCFGVTSCADAGDVESTSEEAAAAIAKQPLQIKGEDPSILWHTQNGDVHVCFLSGSAAYRNTFQTVVTETWEANSGLKFFWEGTCPASPPWNWVTVYFKDVPEGDFGGFAQYGVGGRRTGCSPLFPSDTTEFQVCVRHTPSAHMFRQSMVHEMGHALGFLHEHERWDDPANPTADSPLAQCDSFPESSYPQVLSWFDPASIMRYCRDFDGDGVPDHLQAGHDLYALSASDRVGVAQAYARPGVHLLTTTPAGGLYHNFRQYDGSWPYTFGNVEGQAGDIGTVRDIAAEHTKRGLLYVLAANSAGELKLTTRVREGSWSSFSSSWNDITGQAGNPGVVLRVGLGETKDNLHALVTTSAGKLKLAVKNFFPQPWSAWEDVEARAGDIGTPVKAAAAGIGIRLNICAVSSDGHIWHTYRRDDGWYHSVVDLETLAGERGTFVDVDCSNVGDLLHVVGVTSTGGIYHTMRQTTGAWTGFGNVKGAAGNPGAISRVATSSIMGELHVLVKVNDTPFHTVRWAGAVADNATPWDPFQNVLATVGQYLPANAIAMD